MKVLCTQIGSRQHYEVPLKLSLAGQLALLVTDFWNPLGQRAGWITRLLGSGVLRRAAERFHPEIPSRKVRV
ncbi:MAG: glycosyltransferase, partial [Opitutales bacterium]